MAGTYALFKMIYPNAPWLDLTVAYSGDSNRGTIFWPDAPEIESQDVEMYDRQHLRSIKDYSSITEGNYQSIGRFNIVITDTSFEQMHRLRTRWLSAAEYFNFYPYPDDSNYSGTYYRCYFASPFETEATDPKKWNLNFVFEVINEPMGDGFAL